jgi:hypothetical protein
MIGIANMCGRARICGDTSTKAASTAISTGTGCHSRQQAEGRSRAGSGKRDDAGPAAKRKRARVDHLRQPLEGNPMFAAHGLRKRIDAGNALVLENPAAERDVRISVGVGEQPRPQQHEQGIDPRRHQPWHGRMRDGQSAGAGNDVFGHIGAPESLAKPLWGARSN